MSLRRSRSAFIILPGFGPNSQHAQIHRLGLAAHVSQDKKENATKEGLIQMCEVCDGVAAMVFMQRVQDARDLTHCPPHKVFSTSG